MISYYVCKILSFPELGDKRNGIMIEVVDCKVPTLNPNFTNKAFSKRELAEDYIKSLPENVRDSHVVVYYPR